MLISKVGNAKNPNTSAVFDNMLDILIALLPAALSGILFFGFRAVLLIVCCVVSAALCEWACGRWLLKNCDIKDLSAVVTGLLVALAMPPAMPLGAAVVCSVAATLIPRLFFGGHGCEVVNPAAFGAVLAAVSFPAAINKFSDAFSGFHTAVTPLTAPENSFTLKQLLFGARPGSIGEVGALFLLLGGIYLLVRRVISPIIPVSVLVGAALGALIFNVSITVTLLGGGLLFAAIFLATYSTTSPENKSGQALYGLFIGILTVLLRKYSSFSEGVYFAVCLACLLRPLFSAVPEINIRRGTKA